MNINTRFTTPQSKSGFSLVEMIGVLAIIAVLAVIIVPKVFSTIASARITNTASSVNAVKAAVAEYVSRYGTIPLTSGSAIARLDDLLFSEQLLESRFTAKIGTPAANYNVATYNRTTNAWGGGNAATANQSRIICITSDPNQLPSVANGANYRLSGVTNLGTGLRVVSAVLMGVTGNDARELSLRIDGENGTAALGAADNTGRVAYAAPVAGVTNVYVYIAHQ